jgi:hypothetical protein
MMSFASAVLKYPAVSRVLTESTRDFTQAAPIHDNQKKFEKYKAISKVLSGG